MIIFFYIPALFTQYDLEFFNVKDEEEKKI